MTLIMLEAGAYLGVGLFFGLIVFYVYRHSYKAKQTGPQQVVVPLRVDRTVLLSGQRQAVSDRRNQLKTGPGKDLDKPTKPKNENKPTSDTVEPAETGFGEDLGVALALSQSKESPMSAAKRKSRFAPLQEAADQLKDTYNRNNTL